MRFATRSLVLTGVCVGGWHALRNQAVEFFICCICVLCNQVFEFMTDKKACLKIGMTGCLKLPPPNKKKGKKPKKNADR